MPDNIGAARIDATVTDGAVIIDTLDNQVRTWRSSHSSKPVIVVMKIDVEGMEAAVLNGASTTIDTYRPHIFAEAATNSELVTIESILKKRGYQRLAGRWAGTPVYHFAYRPSLLLRSYCWYQKTTCLSWRIKISTL